MYWAGTEPTVTLLMEMLEAAKCIQDHWHDDTLFKNLNLMGQEISSSHEVLSFRLYFLVMMEPPIYTLS